MSGSVVNINEAAFEEQVLQSDLPVLVDFWAPWCGPCRNIAPILEEVATELAGKVIVAKVNVDDDQPLAARYNVRGIPSLMLFHEGKMISNKVGALSKQQLIDFINEALAVE